MKIVTGFVTKEIEDLTDAEFLTVLRLHSSTQGSITSVAYIPPWLYKEMAARQRRRSQSGAQDERVLPA